MRLKDESGNEVSWGDKLRVGSTVTYIDHFQNNNLLKELYKVSAPWINDRPLATATEVVERQMIYRCTATWLLDTTEPHAIYSPQKLNIPNSSLKILGYVPDLTGKGNHGKLNNFAYTENSGVAADGSIKFDGTDDHITIPTLAHGGKCVMMKVNWSTIGKDLYDQMNTSIGANNFAIYTSGDDNVIAYNIRNSGLTYIDSVLNANIPASQLINITHNITVTNPSVTDATTISPVIGCSTSKSLFANMSLYEFMLFPEIPSEDEIKKLNDVMGIEGGYVESPNYYWDAYGKKNTDTDRNLIADQVSKDVANALEVKNAAYNSESGYEGINNKMKFPNTDGAIVDSGWATDLTRVAFDKINDYNIRITKVNSNRALFWYVSLRTKALYKVTGVSSEKPILFGEDVGNTILVTADTDGIYEVDWSKNMSGTTYKNSCIMAGFIGDCNITIEQVAQYPNGLLLDGVDDHAVNTVIPAMTDFTVIAKRTDLRIMDDPRSSFIQKGLSAVWNAGGAFSEGRTEADKQYCSTFGNTNNISDVYNKEFFYETKNSYNGKAINIITNRTDSNGLSIGAAMNNGSALGGYWEGVFYKAMLYTKTIDQLSINMLKNLFERDELIDVTNPIFKKEEL